MLPTKIIRAVTQKTTRRSYHFASTSYNSCFGDLPVIDGSILRTASIKRLAEHEANPSVWYDDPIKTVVNGKVLGSGPTSTTSDAFEKENGLIHLATQEELDSVKTHLSQFNVETKDFRNQVRAMEKEIFEMENAAELVALQAAEFFKQDGVTEIEESVEANEVERRLNDLLLQDETDGVININRAPVFVGCVSNFSNFLDLSRKVLRHLEVGVPCVVLSRSNTTQHMYRWYQKLDSMMERHGLDRGMLTYGAFTVEQTQQLFTMFPEGPMHITTSRAIADSVMKCHKNVLSSTGGPNTLISTKLTPDIAQAIRWSATIENSGQCTALRHAVVPNATEADVVALLNGGDKITSSSESLINGGFANLFDGHPIAPLENGYTEINPPSHEQACAYKLNTNGNGMPLPVDNLDEHWRQVYVDVSVPNENTVSDPNYLSQLAAWLVRNQPISLAINDEVGKKEMAMQLFEETGQVVYSVGDIEGNCALTCQARPQDGEVFGEFPPRKELNKYTKFPMVIPSPPAAYNASYDSEYLVNKGKIDGNLNIFSLPSMFQSIEDEKTRGYLTIIQEYIEDATKTGPKEGWRNGMEDARTCLYGLQRPPISGQPTVIRVGASTSLSDVAPILLPFVITNACSQVEVSVHSDNAAVIEALEGNGLNVVKENNFENERKKTDIDEWYNLIEVDEHTILKDSNYPLVAQWVSLFFPLGHIKSTKPDDQEFLELFKGSKKWLMYTPECCP